MCLLENDDAYLRQNLAKNVQNKIANGSELVVKFLNQLTSMTSGYLEKHKDVCGYLEKHKDLFMLVYADRLGLYVLAPSSSLEQQDSHLPSLYSHKPLPLLLLQQTQTHHPPPPILLPRTNRTSKASSRHCLKGNTNACPEEVQEGLHGAAPGEPPRRRPGVQVHGPPGAPGRRQALLRRGDGAGVLLPCPRGGGAAAAPGAGVGARPHRQARGRAAQRGADAPNHGRRRLRDGRGGGEGKEGGAEQADREAVPPGVQRRRRREEEEGGGRRRRVRRDGGREEDGADEDAGAEEPRAGRGGAAWPLAAERDAGLCGVPQDAGGAHAMPLQRIPSPAGLMSSGAVISSQGSSHCETAAAGRPA